MSNTNPSNTIPRVNPGMTLLGGPTVVSVTTGGSTNTLASLLGGALALGLKRLKLLPAASGVYFAAGTASASSAPLPAGVWTVLDIRKAEADTLKFYASTVNMTVIQEG